MNPLLSVSDIVVKYGSFTAVDMVSISICPGEVYCLLGPNGAGKTSIIKSIVGIQKPASGKVRILGEDPWVNVEVKNKIGYVPEEPILFEALSPLEHVEFVAAVRRLREEDFKQWLIELINGFKFESSLRKPVFSLSRGNKQKISIILAVLHKPPLLILDEPFTGLDFESSIFLRDLIEKWKSSIGGVLMSTHMLEIAGQLCTRIGLVVGGRLIFEDYRENIRSRLSRNESLASLLIQLTGGRKDQQEG